jgi:hypothetical protein
MTKTILRECIDIIKDLVGNEYLYFDNAVEVKVTPHNNTFHAWAVCVGPKDELYIMDSDESWHMIELGDNHAALIISSLYQRLKLMRINYAKAS